MPEKEKKPGKLIPGKINELPNINNPTHSGGKLGVFIDAENIEIPAYKQGKRIDYKKIVQEYPINVQFKETSFFYYSNEGKEGASAYLPKDINVIICKGNVDSKLTMDVTKKINDYDSFVFLTGDGGYTDLISNLREKSKYIEILYYDDNNFNKTLKGVAHKTEKLNDDFTYIPHKEKYKKLNAEIKILSAEIKKLNTELTTKENKEKFHIRKIEESEKQVKDLEEQRSKLLTEQKEVERCEKEELELQSASSATVEISEEGASIKEDGRGETLNEQVRDLGIEERRGLARNREKEKEQLQSENDESSILINIVEILEYSDNKPAKIDKVRIYVEKNTTHFVAVDDKVEQQMYFNTRVPRIAAKLASYKLDKIKFSIEFSDDKSIDRHTDYSVGLPVAFGIYYILLTFSTFRGSRFNRPFKYEDWLMTGHLHHEDHNLIQLVDKDHIKDKIKAFLEDTTIKNMIIPEGNWGDELKGLYGNGAPLDGNSKNVQVVNVEGYGSKTIYLINKFSDVKEIFGPESRTKTIVLSILGFLLLIGIGFFIYYSTAKHEDLTGKDLESKQKLEQPTETLVEQNKPQTEKKEETLQGVIPETDASDDIEIINPINKAVVINKPDKVLQESGLPPAEAQIVEFKNYTSLVIDVRGKGFELISPDLMEIWDNKSHYVYGKETSFDTNRESPYTISVEDTLRDLPLIIGAAKHKLAPIVGENPLVIMAGQIRLDGSGQNIYIPAEINEKIKEAVKSNNFLKQGRVILIIDGP